MPVITAVALAIPVYFLIAQAAWSQPAPDCTGWLMAFSEYEDEINGEFVPLLDYYSLGDYNANDGFSGVALISELDSPVLDVTYEGENGEGYAVFREIGYSDTGEIHFVDFNPENMLAYGQTGTGQFTVSLYTGDSLVCRESHGLWNDGD